MTANASGVHDALASLLEYPTEGWAARVRAAALEVQAAAPAAARALEPFVRFASGRSNEEAEEAYTATFDSNSECALEVGWHVYGETYQRGVFLVQMRRRLFEAGIEESTELPDHLALVLRMLGRTEGVQADELVRLAVLPALRKIAAGLLEKKSPYAALIAAIEAALSPPSDTHPVPVTEVAHG